MVLTNLGIAVAGKTNSGVQYQRKLKDWNCTIRRKNKISKSVEMWFNAIGSTTSHEDAVITSLHSWYEKVAWPFLTYSLTGRQPYPFHLFLSFPFLPRFLFLLAWLKLPWILFFLSADEIILRQFQLVLPTNFAASRSNLLALDFSPNDPIGSRSTGGHLELLSINNRRTATIFIRFLAYFPEANLSSTSLPSIFWKYSKTFHQQPGNIQRLFTNNSKIFKDFSSTPENIQKLSRLQICLSCKSSTIFRKHSKTFWAVAINSKSNQQQQSTAAASCSNQQCTAAIKGNNQHQQRPALVLPAISTQSTTTSVSYKYGS